MSRTNATRTWVRCANSWCANEIDARRPAQYRGLCPNCYAPDLRTSAESRERVPEGEGVRITNERTRKEGDWR